MGRRTITFSTGGYTPTTPSQLQAAHRNLVSEFQNFASFLTDPTDLDDLRAVAREEYVRLQDAFVRSQQQGPPPPPGGPQTPPGGGGARSGGGGGGAPSLGPSSILFGTESHEPKSIAELEAYKKAVEHEANRLMKAAGNDRYRQTAINNMMMRELNRLDASFANFANLPLSPRPSRPQTAPGGGGSRSGGGGTPPPPSSPSPPSGSNSPINSSNINSNSGAPGSSLPPPPPISGTTPLGDGWKQKLSGFVTSPGAVASGARALTGLAYGSHVSNVLQRFMESFGIRPNFFTGDSEQSDNMDLMVGSTMSGLAAAKPQLFMNKNVLGGLAALELLNAIGMFGGHRTGSKDPDMSEYMRRSLERSGAYEGGDQGSTSPPERYEPRRAPMNEAPQEDDYLRQPWKYKLNIK